MGELNAFYWRQIFALGSFVVKNTKLLSSHGGFSTNAMPSQRNSLFKLTHYDETKKKAYGSQIVRVKENLKSSYGGPNQRQASCTNQQIKALRQGRH